MGDLTRYRLVQATGVRQETTSHCNRTMCTLGFGTTWQWRMPPRESQEASLIRDYEPEPYTSRRAALTPTTKSSTFGSHSLYMTPIRDLH